MKLRNKKTGQIVELDHFSMHYSYHYDYGENARGEQPCSTWNTSLAELNEEWEDYEEPKVFYVIDLDGEILPSNFEYKTIEKSKELGNYFETKEEAEKAVEKLKAWKRLKDKGFRFIGKTYETDKRFGSIFYKVDENTYSEDIIDDLELLFSGGEE